MLRALFALLIALPGLAVAGHTKAELLIDAATPTRAALVLTPDPGWHVYWKNPGDSGLPPVLTWTLPAGSSASEMDFQAPERIAVGPLMNFAYEGETAYLVTLKGAGDIKLHAEWLVCAELCVPESADLTPIIAPKRIAAAELKVPVPAPFKVTAEAAGKSLRLVVPMEGTEAELIKGAAFFPDLPGVIIHAAAQRVATADSALVIDLEADRATTKLSGLIRLETGAGGETFSFSASVTNGLAARDITPLGGAGLPFLTAIALAFLGGIILNGMPCVFPVLALKATALLKGNEARKAEALTYSAGVITSFLGLGAALLALRAGGASVGWGFQLQSPWFIVALALIMTASALALAGKIQLGGSWQGAGDRFTRGSSFMTGVLATLVATPCTGPFMAPALGAAMALPSAQALAVFASLGAGLSVPVLALAFIPAFARILPKPGPWMDTLKRWMALPLGLTVLWLLWVLARQESALTAVIAGAALVVLTGAIMVKNMPARALVLALAIAAPFAAISFIPRAINVPQGLEKQAKPWSERALETARTQGPVFVYFTADWCITCKVNERVALADPNVIAAMKAAKVTVLVADWTRRDDRIATELARHNRAGVPLYLYYRQGAAEPVILPQLLTPDTLIEAVK